MMKNNNVMMIFLRSFYAKWIFLTLAFTASMQGAGVQPSIMLFGGPESNKDVLLASLMNEKNAITLNSYKLETNLAYGNYKLHKHTYDNKNFFILNTKTMSTKSKKDPPDFFYSILNKYPIKGFVLVVNPSLFNTIDHFLQDLVKITKFLPKDKIKEFAGKIKLVVYIPSEKEKFLFKYDFQDCMLLLYTGLSRGTDRITLNLTSNELEKIKKICQTFYEPNRNFQFDTRKHFAPNSDNVIFTKPVYAKAIKGSKTVTYEIDSDDEEYEIAYREKDKRKLWSFMASFENEAIDKKMFNLKKKSLIKDLGKYLDWPRKNYLFILKIAFYTIFISFSLYITYKISGFIKKVFPKNKPQHQEQEEES